MINLTITVRYSCHECGLKNIEVPVQARGAEDIVTWVEEIMIVACGHDHMRRSPSCHPEILSDIMIPIDGVDRVGGAPAQ